MLMIGIEMLHRGKWSKEKYLEKEEELKGMSFYDFK